MLSRSDAAEPVPSEKKPPLLIIDSDGGVDDMLALTMAASLCRDRLAALTAVFGNVGVAQAASNIAYSLRLAGISPLPPIALGAASGSCGFSRGAQDVHGEDGLGGARRVFAGEDPPEFPTLDTVVERLLPMHGRHARFEILAIGPASNAPRLVELLGPSRIVRIVTMGGSLLDRGNITEVAEFNAHADPEALRSVLAGTVPVTLVPLDICRKVVLSRAAIEALPPGPDGRLEPLKAALRAYAAGYRRWEGIEGCFPHDAIALLVLLRPDRFHIVRCDVDVDLTPERYGMTRAMRMDDGGRHGVAFGGDLKWVRGMIERGWLRDAAGSAT
ncbi:nucleoside hydrolase [Lutibaculum baratangense]|uniref:Inosine-uridine preferring nucleoside hydrolase n=1 Tax=Lutibaculum baratangense AMV1 TaxID=631454 RepID=V4TKY8_9HYPH|nr:nucleoside hydrolase [Lutibaculum baratangense]ESR26483.1 Inosine-uridine preferring nucleoside hydrolase [Lutibaculum baratangense AMV1]